ncbi:hypothetical protein Tco_0346444, partial [Tanacetum coccineum]
SVMSDSDETGVTFTEVSSPFEGLSDIGSPRADDHEYLELPESDPEADPKEDDDEDPEEDPADRGDDDDDEEGSSEDDEDDDINMEAD